MRMPERVQSWLGTHRAGHTKSPCSKATKCILTQSSPNVAMARCETRRCGLFHLPPCTAWWGVARKSSMKRTLTVWRDLPPPEPLPPPPAQSPRRTSKESDRSFRGFCRPAALSLQNAAAPWPGARQKNGKSALHRVVPALARFSRIFFASTYWDKVRTAVCVSRPHRRCFTRTPLSSVSLECPSRSARPPRALPPPLFCLSGTLLLPFQLSRHAPPVAPSAAPPPSPPRR